MVIVMNMSSCQIEREATATGGYDDEVMYAGWNPQLACVDAGHLSPAHPAGLPPALAEADIEAFLEKIYACQG